MTIRILIADDHGVIRAGLHALLDKEPGMQVIGEAADGQEAVDKALKLRPDVLLLDITMPVLDGIKVTSQLRAALPATHILILTLHEGVSMLREAIAAGASGYIVKRAVDVELIGAIQAVARGEMYVHPSMTQALIQDMSPLAGSSTPIGVLSPRETEVLRLVARGQTNRQIAKTLSLSVRTVDSHRANLMNKLGVSSRAELIQYALEHHLLE